MVEILRLCWKQNMRGDRGYRTTLTSFSRWQMKNGLNGKGKTLNICGTMPPILFIPWENNWLLNKNSLDDLEITDQGHSKGKVLQLPWPQISPDWEMGRLAGSAARCWPTRCWLNMTHPTLVNKVIMFLMRNSFVWKKSLMVSASSLVLQLSYSSSTTCAARGVVTRGDIVVAAAVTGNKQRQRGLKGQGQ